MFCSQGRYEEEEGEDAEESEVNNNKKGKKYKAVMNLNSRTMN